MIEVHISKAADRTWKLGAAILPKGGLGGLAEEAELGTLKEPTFAAASALLSECPLDQASFKPNADRWPVPPPKFQIVNDGTAPPIPFSFGKLTCPL